MMRAAVRPWQVAVYAAVLLFVVFEVGRSVWRVEIVVFRGYTELGEQILAGGDPYSLHLNTWPPFFGFVAAALALIARGSLRFTVVLWQLCAVAALWGSCRLLARFLVDRGETLRFWPGPDTLGFTSSAVLVPLGMTARLLQEHLQHTQVNLLLLYLCLLAFHQFREERPGRGGLLLALAASLKAVPVLLVGYLVFRRRWRAVAWTGAFLVVLNVVLPALAFGPRAALDQWRAWRAVAAREVAAPEARYYNQSLLAAVKRVVTERGDDLDPIRTAVADWSPDAALRLFVALAGVGAVGLVLAFGVRPPDPRSRRAAREWAICLGAMTVVSPLAWKAHYVTLLAPAFVAWGILRGPDPPGRWRWALFWSSVACLTLSAPVFVGEGINNTLESLNVITVGAVLVLVLATLPPRRLPANSVAHSSH